MIILPNITNGMYDSTLICVLGEGLLSGVLSHLLLDVITTDGIWSFILAPISIFKSKHKDDIKDYLFRLSLVPKIKFFSTDDSNSPWERLVRGMMVVGIVLILLYILYLWSPYRVSFKL